MSKIFDGKVAIVTGAGAEDGIGRATALMFAEKGAMVAVADILDGGNETVKLIEKIGGKGLFIKTDVTKPEEVEAMVKGTVDHFGRLDFAHNNAGIEGKMAPTADCTVENFDLTIAVNLRGIFLCMKYEIPALIASGGGAIVNTASAAGLVGYASLPAYVASKHGVNGLTKTAAIEYAASGIRVNSVCPGPIQTAMMDRLGVVMGVDDAGAVFSANQPIKRAGKPEDIAEMATFLCSDSASYITGVNYAVDGGFTTG